MQEDLSSGKDKELTLLLQVRSSAVFVPEYSTLENDTEEENYMFTYAVRMRKLAAEDDSHISAYNSCQLSSRHWIIRENGAFKTEVRGPGVIGQVIYILHNLDPVLMSSCLHAQQSELCAL